MPSNFMCLVLKLLQIQPDAEVVREYILQEDSKYLRLLGAFYLRLTGKADQVRVPCSTVAFPVFAPVHCGAENAVASTYLASTKMHCIRKSKWSVDCPGSSTLAFSDNRSGNP